MSLPLYMLVWPMTPKRLLVAVLSGLVPAAVAAQECPTGGIPENAYLRLLNEQFARLINPASGNSIGNFGAYDHKDGEVSFAASIVRESGRVLALKASGRGPAGLLGLRQDGKANGSVAVEAQLHRLSRGHDFLIYSLPSCETYARLKQKALTDEERQKAELTLNVPRINARRTLVRLRADSVRRDSIIGSINRVQPVPAPEQSRLDSLLAERHLANLAIRDAIAADKPSTASQETAAGTVRALAIQAAEKALEITGFRVSWWSFGAGFSNNTFQHFDSTAAFASQLVSRNWLGYSARLNYSVYALDPEPGGSWYLTIGARVARGDNFATLKKTTLSETTQFGPAEGDRERVKSITAYTGDYVTGLETIDVSLDWYLFLHDGRTAAFHMYPAVVAGEGVKPVTNTGFGLVLLYQAPGSASTLVNAELYWEFVDLFETRDPELSPIKRGTLGFRFSVPFMFALKG